MNDHGSDEDNPAPAFGFTQADCVTWDEFKKIDLRELDPQYDEKSSDLMFLDDDYDNDNVQPSDQNISTLGSDYNQSRQQGSLCVHHNDFNQNILKTSVRGTRPSISYNTNTTSPFVDEFESEFPDLDFEELDKSIENYLTQAQSPEKNPYKTQKDLYELTELELAQLVPRTVSNTPRVQMFPPSSEMIFDRYRVVRTRDVIESYTKILVVMLWDASMIPSSTRDSTLINTQQVEIARNGHGMVFLRGEWYHTKIEDGDVIHICSLTGKFETGVNGLPMVLHTTPPAGSVADDLVLVVHPDVLLTPTTISESVTCTRRAILKNRIGSTGLQSSDPLFRTMRHQLVQACIRSNNFANEFTRKEVDLIVRQNAEGLIACKVSSQQAETEICKVLPQMMRFFRDFTKLGESMSGVMGSGRLESHGDYPSVRFVVENVELIEDMIVSQELGLKGAVDFIVKATISDDSSRGNALSTTSLVCVELKTGHSQSTQTAHMAQLALYNVMVHARYGPTAAHPSIGSGALLYINNEDLRATHIAPFVTEIKSLINQRNVVACEQLRACKPRGVKYLALVGDAENERSELAKVINPAPPANLPDLETSLSSCQRCYINRECMMYAAAKSASLDPAISEKHRELMTQITGDVLPSDFEYFQKWDRLIDLEAHFATSSSASAWLIPSDERESATGKSISSLVFDSVETPSVENRTTPSIICFKRSDNSSLTTPLTALGFEKGCHAVLSVDHTSLSTSVVGTARSYRPHMHIVRGIVDRVTEKAVYIRGTVDDVARLVRIQGRHNDQPTHLHYRLDRDEVAIGVGTLRQNLINLFVSSSKEDVALAKRTERNRKLRRLLVHLEAPRFDPELGSNLFTRQSSAPCIHVPGCHLKELSAEFYALNPDQQAATRRVLSARDFALIQGLPGTGKTSIISFIVRLLVAHGMRVLVTSYTHSAVDNLLLKLVQSGVGRRTSGASPCLVRVGFKTSCHPDIVAFLCEELASSIEGLNRESSKSPQPESMKTVMQSARVVGITALSIPGSSLLAIEDFDVVIVDEAGQINQPAIIGALQAAGKFVLVGDHMQLPPLVQSELAEDGGFGESMLKRLSDKHPSSVAQLTLQYRMAESICQASNDIMYKGKLRCADSLVANKKLCFPDGLSNTTSWASWVRKAIDPQACVVFVNTDPVSMHYGGRDFLERKLSKECAVVNDIEAAITRTLIQKFIAAGVDGTSMGIICPFRAQLRLLEKDPVLDKYRKAGLELSTIDRFQGRDKDVIILSMVRSNERGSVGRLLSDSRRLNVAVTRAKCKLVVVGSFGTLHKGSAALRPALERIRNSGGVVSFAQ